MLDSIKAAVQDERVYLFMDNASFHRNPEMKKRMIDHNIEAVMNVAYRYEFNPCERLWSQYK